MVIGNLVDEVSIRFMRRSIRLRVNSPQGLIMRRIRSYLHHCINILSFLKYNRYEKFFWLGQFSNVLLSSYESG